MRGDITQAGTPFHELFALLAVIAASGVIFAAVYLLVAVQRVFFGPIKHAENERLHDLSLRESLVLAPLMLVAVGMGVYPQPFLDVINPAAQSYAQQFRARAGLPPLLRGAPPSRVAEGGLPSLPGSNTDPSSNDRQRYHVQEALPWRRNLPHGPGVTP